VTRLAPNSAESSDSLGSTVPAGAPTARARSSSAISWYLIRLTPDGAADGDDSEVGRDGFAGGGTLVL
jgi:hypothetical protein